MFNSPHTVSSTASLHIPKVYEPYITEQRVVQQLKASNKDNYCDYALMGGVLILFIVLLTLTDLRTLLWTTNEWQLTTHLAIMNFSLWLNILRDFSFFTLACTLNCFYYTQHIVALFDSQKHMTKKIKLGDPLLKLRKLEKTCYLPLFCTDATRMH